MKTLDRKNEFLISIVIPCFNSENSIEGLLKEISDFVSIEFDVLEIICVNDNSSDGTKHILNKLKKTSKQLKIINNEINIGQLKSTLSGIEASNGSLIVTLDDDSQHPPSEINKLIESCIKTNSDFVIGYWKPDEGIIRNISSIFANLILNLISFNFKNFKFSAFRVINSRIKSKVVCEFQNSVFMDLRKISDNYKMVEVKHNPVPKGRDYTKFNKRFKLMISHLIQEIK